MDPLKDWFVDAPWGKIALTSWGTTTGEPVLMVHGRQDSSTTFVPLLGMLPQHYYYVCVDMPGNGRSDPLPISIKLTRLHFVAALEAVVKKLGWERFIYIGHSMGCENGLFFNAIHPGKVKKFILLDLGPPLQRLYVNDPVEYFRDMYDRYYSNYDEENRGYRVYTKRQALEAVMKNRGMTQRQAELILTRNLVELGHGFYRTSWDRRLKTLAPQNYTGDYYYELFSKDSVPTLVVAASEGTPGYVNGKEFSKELMEKMEKNLKSFVIVKVDGGHDVHFTNPERCAAVVREFLTKDFGKSKL